MIAPRYRKESRVWYMRWPKGYKCQRCGVAKEYGNSFMCYDCDDGYRALECKEW